MMITNYDPPRKIREIARDYQTKERPLKRMVTPIRRIEPYNRYQQKSREEGLGKHLDLQA